MKRKRRSRGFTLIELLAVLVIVTILVTMAVSRYIEVRNKGLVGAATADLNMTRKLLACYAVDYSGYPSSAGTWSDLETELTDPDGRPYGNLPVSYTFDFLSYDLDGNGDYILRIQVSDNHQTVLVATPDGIQRE